ncbi:nose resistant to fluoxetine protein 6-like [Babylonia areolata]|uniref:nose resistant to fluoxetine protein 6-like n=1 Tax=Babylonia areolata TaxID=304850 RepID=UPI003FD64E15
MALGSTSFLVSLGVCVPDTCSSHDIEVMLSFVLELLNVTSPQIKPFVTCAETRPINAKAVVAIVICSIILCLMVAGTVVDIVFIQRPQWAMKQMQGDDSTEDNINGPVHQNPEHELLLPKTQTKAAMPQLGTAGKVLVSFSVYTNGEKLLSTKQAPGSLTCVHGIRFLSISWVVLGHTWAFPGSVGMNVIPYLQDLTSKWTYQAITNATVSVDTFFVLSGLLVAYLTLKEMKKRGGKLNWFLFYFHRFWRLTPAYMLCLMVYTCLAPYWGDGPFWPSKFQDEDFCADNWWTNLLYINNFVNTKEACFAHSWYLANDMQFYILSPLIFVPLFFFPVLGVVVAGAFLLVTAIVPGVLSQQHGFPPGLLQPVEALNPNSSSVTMDYMDIYYFKPYNRMGPYIIGLLAGYFLYRTDCKLRISWLVNAVLWALATACALAVLFGLSDDSYTNPVTVPVAAFYNAVSRTVWGACVAWVVIACVTGNGGFVNTILSWSAFVPVSRLSYCIYLLHIMVIMLYVMNRRATIFFDDVNLVFLYLGSLVASCVVAFVASLAFESPMMGLERVFLRPSSSSASPKRGGEKQ